MKRLVGDFLTIPFMVAVALFWASQAPSAPVLAQQAGAITHNWHTHNPDTNRLDLGCEYMAPGKSTKLVLYAYDDLLEDYIEIDAKTYTPQPGPKKVTFGKADARFTDNGEFMVELLVFDAQQNDYVYADSYSEELSGLSGDNIYVNQGWSGVLSTQYANAVEVHCPYEYSLEYSFIPGAPQAIDVWLYHRASDTDPWIHTPPSTGKAEYVYAQDDTEGKTNIAKFLRVPIAQGQTEMEAKLVFRDRNTGEVIVDGSVQQIDLDLP